MDDLPDAALCNCLAIRQAARQVTQLYDRHLGAVGLRGTQYSVLARLERSGGLSINELAAAMAMDRTTMGRAVRPLERDGLVAIGRGRDGRTRALVLTEAGTQRLRAAVPLWRKAQAEFEAAFGGQETVALRATMTRVVDTMAQRGGTGTAPAGD